jgi:hypothetical protein
MAFATVSIWAEAAKAGAPCSAAWSNPPMPEGTAQVLQGSAGLHPVRGEYVAQVLEPQFRETSFLACRLPQTS